MNAEHKLIARIVSLGAVCLAFVHMVWPSLGIDAVTISLIVIAAIPWLLPLLKSLELPGGVKIELKDAKAATDKVVGRVISLRASIKARSSTSDVNMSIEDPFSTLRHVAERDPNLALVGFRMEIEKRLLRIAEQNDIRTERTSLPNIVRNLQSKEILEPSAASGLMELIALGNQAAHGANVSPDAASWVLDVGPSIVNALD